MRKINKKASIFALGMLVVLLLALSSIYFLSITRSKELSGEFSIGENQLSFFTTMQEAEKSILYGEGDLGLHCTSRFMKLHLQEDSRQRHYAASQGIILSGGKTTTQNAILQYKISSKALRRR